MQGSKSSVCKLETFRESQDRQGPRTQFTIVSISRVVMQVGVYRDAKCSDLYFLMCFAVASLFVRFCDNLMAGADHFQVNFEAVYTEKVLMTRASIRCRYLCSKR